MDWTADVFDFDAGGEHRVLRIEVSYKDTPVLWIFKIEGVLKIEYVGDGTAWVMDASWLTRLLQQIESDPHISGSLDPRVGRSSRGCHAIPCAIDLPRDRPTR